MIKKLAVSGAVFAAVALPFAASASSPAHSLPAYTTAYDFWDNTPPGSAEISDPVLHRTAGGKGTYTNPVTVAVGHSISAGHDVLDYARGTRFYVPNVRRYFLVEDTCGDGPKPQNGPCHRLDTPGNRAPKGAKLWIDLWAGGSKATRSQGEKCMSKITDGNGAVHTVIINPRKDYVVVSGDLIGAGGRCSAGYGNTAIVKR